MPLNVPMDMEVGKQVSQIRFRYSLPSGDRTFETYGTTITEMLTVGSLLARMMDARVEVMANNLTVFDGTFRELAVLVCEREHAALVQKILAPVQPDQLGLLEACKRIVAEDAAGEISIGAIEDCQAAIGKVEGS